MKFDGSMLGFLTPQNVGFEERAPHEAGFSATYRTHIAPKLARIEAQRWTAIASIALILGLCGWGAWAAIEHDSPAAFRLAGGLALSLPFIPATIFWVRKERQLLSAVCAHFPGLSCGVDVDVSADRLAPYRRLGLLPPPQDPSIFKAFSEFEELVELEEELKGSHRGIAIWLGEGVVVEKSGKSAFNLFDGTLVEFTLPPDASLPATASDAIRQPLEALAEMLGSTEMTYGVEGNVVYVTMPHPGKGRPMNLGGISRSAYACEPGIRAILAQLSKLYAVTDILADALATQSSHAAPAAPVSAASQSESSTIA